MGASQTLTCIHHVMVKMKKIMQCPSVLALILSESFYK